MYGLSLRDIRDIIHSEMFVAKVAELAKEMALTGEMAPLKERLLKAREVTAASRLLSEIDNTSDGTAATRITAAKAVLDIRAQKENAQFLAVELSPEKFRMIFSTGFSPIKPQPDSIFGE